MIKNMNITEAKDHRDGIVNLLTTEKLPVEDLPTALNNFFVAKKGDELIGVIGLEVYGNYSLLRSLAVRPEFRGLGLAGRLVDKIEALARSKGLNAIYLLTETATDYFERKNYKKIARDEVPTALQQSSEFGHVCPESAIVMMKALNQNN